MVASHDHFLVLLSVAISIVAAYSAQDLSERIRDTHGRAWLAWLIGGALAGGICTSSMHYTAMAAFHLPVPVAYHVPTVVLSILISAAGSGVALLILSGTRAGWFAVFAASGFLGGVGIAGMHYVAMASMRLQGMHHYSAELVWLSVVLAIVISWMALAFTFLHAGDAPGRRLRYHGSAMLRGIANPVMHFTAMAAVTFSYAEQLPEMLHTVSISYIDVIVLSIVPAMVLVVMLLTSLADRLGRETSLLDELFEQAPQAVALLDANKQVVRVNREFTRLFGYALPEIVGQRLDGLIFADESFRTELWASKHRLDAECVLGRKDGSRLQAALTWVPVKVPQGQVEIYAIFRDVTQEKHALEKLKLSERRLAEAQRAAHVGSWERDLRTNELTWSDEVYRLFGLPADSVELSFQAFLNLLLPQDKDRIVTLAREAVRERRSFQCDYRITRTDGSVRVIHDRGNIILNEQGDAVRLVGTAQDVTELRQAEQALQEHTAQLRALSRRLLEIQEAERRHLALELHDEVGQLLTGLRLLLKPNGEALSDGGQSRLEQARAIVDALLEKVRGLSFDLRPVVLDQLGFIPALLELFENYTRQTGVLVRFRHKDVERRFAPEVETTAYRIVQEALTNVARHAQVREATVRAWATQDVLNVQIEDRGRGFDPEAVLATSHSSGLAGMRERAMLLSGQLTIDSRPGDGTQITAELPLGQPTPEEKP